MNNKQRALIGGSVLLLVLSGWAYSRASGEVITVCVEKDGLMHVLGKVLSVLIVKATSRF